MKTHFVYRGLGHWIFAFFLSASVLGLKAFQPGDLDNGFVPGVSGGLPLRCVLADSDGKILVGGSSAFVTSGLPLSRGSIARLGADGALEPSYSPPVDGTCYCLVELEDGSVLAGGSLRFMETGLPQTVFRLTKDGRLHPDFKLGDAVDGEVWAIAVQKDGRLLIGGRFNTVGGLPRKNLARLNKDGTVDPNFNPGEGFQSVLGNGGNSWVRSVELDSQGRIVVAGLFDVVDLHSSPGVARLFSEGSFDDSFVSPLRYDSNVRAARSQADGRILLGGAIQIGATTTAISRLLPDGEVDPTFTGQAPLVPVSNINQLRVDSVGRILVGSFQDSFGRAPGYLLRLGLDGAVDPSFARAYTNLTDGAVYALAIQPDDKILVVGDFPTAQGLARSGVARLWGGSGSAQSPSLDAVPQVIRGTRGAVMRLEARPLGNPRPELLWIRNGVPLPGATNAWLDLSNLGDSDGGDYSIRMTNSEGVATGLVATVCVDAGSVGFGAGDSSFYPVVSNAPIIGLLEQSGCRILVANTLGIRRLSREGIEDPGFGRDTRSLSLQQMALDAQGGILAVGGFITVAGLPRNGVARFNSEGVLDSSFVPPADAVGAGSVVAGDVQGRVYVARFESSSGMASLSRLLTSGILDPSFTPVTNVSGSINVVLPMASGGVLVAGRFSSILGQSRGSVVRLSDEGIIDGSFLGGADGEIRSVVAKADGSLVFGGSFVSFNNSPFPRLVVTDKDGVIDPNFIAGSAKYPVKQLAVDPLGAILVCNILSASEILGGAPPFSRLGSHGEVAPQSSGVPLFAGRGLNAGLMTTCGDWIVGGQFTTIGGLLRLNLARVYLSPQPEVAPAILTQPRSITQPFGKSVTLGVSALGQPITFQWYRDGQRIAGANQTVFVESVWDATKSRRYTVTLSNSLGVATSETAIVTSLLDLPKFVTQPRSQTAYERQAVVMTATLVGNSKPNLQWWRNGAPIAGETNLTLFIPETRTADFGDYTLTASNTGGTVTSAVARLSVGTRVDLNHALNTTNWTWVSTPGCCWSEDLGTSSDSVASAGSGPIPLTADQSVLQTRLYGPGTLSFKWKVSSRTNAHFLVYQGTGGAVAPISGESEWGDVQVKVAAGPVDATWRYVKRSGDPQGADRGWIDQVNFQPSAPAAPKVLVQPASAKAVSSVPLRLAVFAEGAGTLSYQWKKNGIDVPGATGSLFVIPKPVMSDSGNYSVILTTEYGQTMSAEAQVQILPGPPQLVSPRWEAGSGLRFDLAGEALATYRVEFSEDLVTWQLLREFVAESAVTTVQDSGSSRGDARFYRVIVLP